MEVGHSSFAWKRLLQHRAHLLVLVAVIVGLAAYLAPSAWDRSAPPAAETLPSPSRDYSVQYFAPGREFPLDRVAVTESISRAIRSAQPPVLSALPAAPLVPRSETFSPTLVTPTIIIQDEDEEKLQLQLP
jgi:hypothetical protein